ncbi:MAG: zinc-ribbon domain-containing protein, partial [Salinibacter sp.]
MSTDDRTCPSCGARVSAGAARCDLCGTSLEEAEPSDEDDKVPVSETSPESSAEP